MRYASVCSGIEAPSAAWHPMGWRAQFFAEIDAFPSAVLAHRYPDVPNLGDMTRFKEWPDATLDVLIGGTPCQSFSVAGLRKGMADPRGNLALVFLAIADRFRPRWVVWENVPGVLSSSGGRDFGAFLGGLGQLGYGWAYRVLDAQYFGVPQRRRRVFVVGCLGDWRGAAAVLFERASLSGNPAPRREAGEKAAGTIVARSSRGGGQTNSPGYHADDCVIARCITRGERTTLVAHSLRADGFDASEDGTGRGTPLVPCYGDYRDRLPGERSNAYWQRMTDHEREHGINPYAFDARQSDVIQYGDKSGPLDTCGHSVAVAIQAGALAAEPGAKQQTFAHIGMQVRRLTPRECERLQGFPDDYTLITYRGKPAADGPRYKALGNSMAVPVIAWIGQRIEMAEEVRRVEAAA